MTSIKLIIAGSRGLSPSDVEIDAALVDAGWSGKVAEVISGTAPGADRCGERWARARNIPIRLMPADWSKYGKRAGYLRNADMGAYGDALLLFWDGVSSGSKLMLEIMKGLEKPYVVVRG